MAEPVPAPLKIPEISRFLNRANQVRSFKPAIAYWCEYHAVNQIVSKNLHNGDDDCFNFTKTLLLRLETTKNERSDDVAITDNDVGRAYVEEFAHETFDRAERTLRANKVTRQTADTFDAAATFFDLTHEWGTPEADIVQKIKFAKWNAARILKAIREGKDPNETNPKLSEPKQESVVDMDLDPLDPDVQQITDSAPPRAVQVEDVEDTGEPPLQELGALSGPPCEQSPPAAAPPALEEYFPPQQSTAQTGSSQMPPQQPTTQIPPLATPQVPPPTATQPTPATPAAAATKPFPPISLPPTQLHPPSSLPVATPPVSASPALASDQSKRVGAGNGPFAGDQKSLNQAQKHAKWAISALNFEDVPTAVQELRNALSVLGAL